MSMLSQASARRLADALSQPVSVQAAMPDLPPDFFSEYSPLWIAILARVNARSDTEASATAGHVDAAITAAMHDYGRVVAAECVRILQSVGPDNPMTANDCIDAIRKRFNLE